MDDSDPFAAPHRLPTAARPLLGLTILVVEDSLYACDAMRLLCLRSGARIRRADCLASARRHLQIYRPSAIIVDIGLPDGSGLGLISDLAAAAPRIPVILGMSADDGVEGAAIAAGADGFLAKPVESLPAFQRMILDLLPEERRPAGPRHIDDTEISPDPLAYREDMARLADLLADLGDETRFDYAAQFAQGVARCAGDRVLADAAARLAEIRRKGRPAGPLAARIAGLVRDRLHRREAI